MCKYGMVAYKPHYACFQCQKTFKRRLMRDIDRDKGRDYVDIPAKCPECGSLMADMGLDFEAPKKSNHKAWKHLQTLYKVGITFHSCGCCGPGYIPANSCALLAHLEDIKAGYIEHRRFWSSRKEPKQHRTQKEKQLDKKINGQFLYFVPNELTEGTRRNPKVNISKAIDYWSEKIEAVDEQIALVKKNLN